MKTLVIRQHPKSSNDLQIGWDFGDGRVITFGAVPKTQDLEKFISDLRAQQLSIGNDDFEVKMSIAQKRTHEEMMKDMDEFDALVKERISDGDLVCICGHTAEEHYNDGGDYTSKVSCEAGLNDGSPCPCSDFTHPMEPIWD